MASVVAERARVSISLAEAHAVPRWEATQDPLVAPHSIPNSPRLRANGALVLALMGVASETARVSLIKAQPARDTHAYQHNSVATTIKA